MHKEKLGESTGPWCKILVDDQKIICMVKKIPFMTTEYASRGIITRCKSLEKTEGWSLQKHCGRTFYGLVQQKWKKSAWSKTDGKTRNSSWPKVTTHLSNMAVLLLWVSEWVIWLSCILPDEDQTIGRDSKKKKKRKQEAREMLKAI